MDKVANRRDVIIFHAGTKKREDGSFETAGGRVLSVAGLGLSLEEAHKRAYEVIGPNGIYFDKVHSRGDIGLRRRK